MVLRLNPPSGSACRLTSPSSACASRKMSSSAHANASKKPNARPSVLASSPRPRARPGSGRAARRKMTRGRVPGPKRPERVLSGRRARRAPGQLARRGGLGIAGEPSSGAARRGVCGRGACSRSAYVPSAYVPSACMRGVCRRGLCSRKPYSRSPRDVRGAARSAEFRQSAVRAPRPRAGRELRARVYPPNGCCAGAHGPPSPAERLESRPCRLCRWPLASPLHPCRCLRARPGSTTRPSQRRQSRHREYSAQRATDAGAQLQPRRTRRPGQGGLVHAR